jgi:hypothetical protein
LMFGTDRGRPFVRGAAIAATGFAAFVITGCSKTQTGQQALEQQLAATGQSLMSVAQFAGKVTIDGKPPELERGHALLVFLYDPKNPPTKDKPARRATVNKNGDFTFRTYEKADGAPVGSYVVLFAVLQPKGHGVFLGPDELKNLYNDPDKNAKNPDLNVTVERPGKTNYSFDLKVAGADHAQPGPHAITKIDRRY